MTAYNSLLDFLDEPEHVRVFREPEEKRRRDSKRILILRRLLQGPAYNSELARITWKFRARISELRQRGCIIEARRVEGGLWRYELLNPDVGWAVLAELEGEVEGDD